MNSKLRISAITLSISSFNFWMWTGRIQCFSPQHHLTDLSSLGHQLWLCLPEYHPEGPSYTSWCSPSPAFHRLWNLRKLQEKKTVKHTFATIICHMFHLKMFLLIFNLHFLTTVEKEVSLANAPSKPCGFTDRHATTNQNYYDVLEKLEPQKDAAVKPPPVQWHEDVMQTAEHGSVTTDKWLCDAPGAVGLISPWSL